MTPSVRLIDINVSALGAMCTSLFLYDAHPGILFLLTFNRDEFYNRYGSGPSHAQVWQDNKMLHMHLDVPVTHDKDADRVCRYVQTHQRSTFLGGQSRDPSWPRLDWGRHLAGCRENRPLCFADKLPRGEAIGNLAIRHAFSFQLFPQQGLCRPI